ncbi:hypothetical protein EV356DRAFT_532948 [Viridothelium virens]|uniref:Uncharacterized protein n=1 Tax=Viridothelium virens TaxID=1048519 RepID=A0A6A6H8P8_VIRVR|nr:hypothetical protein EV356DRAFT_532948 [Viridothelium virens]
MKSIEVPLSLLKRGPEIIERTEKKSSGGSIRLKRPLSADEFSDNNSVSLKKVRFTTENDESEDKSEGDTDSEAEDEEDFGTSEDLGKRKIDTVPSNVRRESIIKYSVKEPRRGKKVIEIESAQQEQPEPGSNHEARGRTRKIVTSKWDPMEDARNRQILAVKDQSGIVRFLHIDPKPEAMSQHFNELHDLIKSFILSWYDFRELTTLNWRPYVDERPLEFLERNTPTELKYYITCHASGGPSGIDGWEKLFKDKDAREAVMYGVIGKALEEHVFAELLFGADEEQKEQLEQLETGCAGKDGFERTGIRARYIKEALKSQQWSGVLHHPPRYWSQVDNITLQLFTLIYPLLLLNPGTVGLELLERQSVDNGIFAEAQSTQRSPSEPGSLRRAELRKLLLDLRMIVKSAAMSSLIIRLSADTIFHFQAMFKNTVFERDVMQSWDVDFIWNGDTENMDNNLDEAYRAEHAEDEPVIQVICSPAIVMFKKGGPPEAEKPGERGLRVKTLRKALVNLRWGRKRDIPPKPNDGYLEFKEALDVAREIYNERDATYAQLDLAAKERTDREEADVRRKQAAVRARKKSQSRSCIVM